MVKTGILDANSQMAGEVIRLLVNHPETELTNLFYPRMAGQKVSKIHHGLIGEEVLLFSDVLSLDDLDLLIVMEPDKLPAELLKRINEKDLKIIYAKPPQLFPENVDYPQTGLSEINRKGLVRGATQAWILPAPIVPVLIALVPLARYMLLNSDIYIHVEVPQDIAEESNTDFFKDQIKEILHDSQQSFKDNVIIEVKPLENRERNYRAHIKVKTNVSIDEIKKIYEQIYDDHNFTFIADREIENSEVIGTQKVLIYLSNSSDDSLDIQVIADARMRGGAGDIVHVLNLLFGLHEKTGLTLKAQNYFKS